MYDKSRSDGKVIEAPRFTYGVLDGVPMLFQLAEWAVVIAGLQYIDERFGFLAAKVAWIVLAGGFAVYVGTLASNVLWRTVEDPYRSKPWRVFSYGVAPVLSGAVTWGLYQLVQAMLAAQQG